MRKPLDHTPARAWPKCGFSPLSRRRLISYGPTANAGATRKKPERSHWKGRSTVTSSLA